MHGDVVEAARPIEHRREDLHDPRLAGGGGQVQDPQILDVGALAMRPDSTRRRRAGT